MTMLLQYLHAGQEVMTVQATAHATLKLFSSSYQVIDPGNRLVRMTAHGFGIANCFVRIIF